MKTIYYLIFSAILAVSSVSCSDFLDRDPDNIIPDPQLFTDANMVNAVVANFYGRIEWGQRIGDSGQYIYLDEACKSDGGPDNTSDYGDGMWRVYDYNLIRDINEFLQNLRSSMASSLDPEFRKKTEGEVRFIRAWVYFNMARCMGGMPLVGDEVFQYTPGMDVTPMQVPRSTEAATYDYVISECTAVSSMLPDDPTRNTNAARGNKWGALALKTRASIYAASIAKYNSLLPQPIKTAGGEVGIPVDKAQSYYQLALTTAKEIIESGKYSLFTSNPDKGRNFYEALATKTGNNEVIWAMDYFYPGQTTNFTNINIPVSLQEDIDATVHTPILNLVEAFEYVDNRDGTLKATDANGDYIFYDHAADIFKDKDARLAGTVIYPGSTFRAQIVDFQAGRKKWENGKWVNEIGATGSVDANKETITGINGPVVTNDQWKNKVGFCMKKFMDEKLGSGSRGRGSEMWFVRMRYAEILMIAAEASMELGDVPTALGYINQIRDRAGIQPLTTLTIDDIIRERRVEFAFENHRWWDLKRIRQAHIIWDGNRDNPKAVQYALFPYKVYNPGNANHGKWVFDKQPVHMAPSPRYFQMKNYYNFLDNGWLNNNPKLVKNPYQ